MHLVIAEKPAVAQSIAAVLGAKKKESGYLIGAGYIVSWCVGHLVELAMPHLYDERYVKWQWDHLPILPEAWQYMVCDATRKQFNILRTLMNDARVDTMDIPLSQIQRGMGKPTISGLVIVPSCLSVRQSVS